MICDCCKEEVESFAYTYPAGFGLCEDCNHNVEVCELFREIEELLAREGHGPDCGVVQLLGELKILTGYEFEPDPEAVPHQKRCRESLTTEQN